VPIPARPTSASFRSLQKAVKGVESGACSSRPRRWRLPASIRPGNAIAPAAAHPIAPPRPAATGRLPPAASQGPSRPPRRFAVASRAWQTHPSPQALPKNPPGRHLWLKWHDREAWQNRKKPSVRPGWIPTSNIGHTCLAPSLRGGTKQLGQTPPLRGSGRLFPARLLGTWSPRARAVHCRDHIPAPPRCRPFRPRGRTSAAGARLVPTQDNAVNLRRGDPCDVTFSAWPC